MSTLLDKQQWSGGAPEPETAAVDDMLSRVAAMAPLVASHARDMERERHLAGEIVTALKSARVYSMLVPRRYGGLELDVPSALRVVSALAKLEGAVGWNAMIGSFGNLLPFLSTPALCEQIFGDREEHILAGSGQPAGTAERVPGGWMVTGTWPFLSGCREAEWLAGACIMAENGSPIPAADGAGPTIRVCAMPAECWDIRDTWHTFGLKGTGSHDAALHEVFVPDENVFDFPFGKSFAPDRVFGMIPELVSLQHSAFAVGVAEGAVADLVALARSGTKQLRMTVPLAETERFKEALGRLHAELTAARTLLGAQATQVWQHTERAEAKDMNRVAELQGLAVWIVSGCLRVAEGCFELAGARAIYESSSLQRRMRDIRVAAQHAWVHPRNYVAAGAAVFSGLS